MSVCRAPDLVTAFGEAASTAYKGVVKPVEGTILTVIRAIADDAALTARDTDDLVSILEHVAFAAHETVLLTPSLLPVLREAGVVDAGGQGLYVIIEGMLRHLHGEAIDDVAAPGVETGLVAAEGLVTEAGYGYDVQFLLLGQGFDVATIRDEINAMGDSALVVGDPSTVKVHVHVPDPGVPISYGAGLGSLRDVVVEDMQAQFADFVAGQDGSGAEGAVPPGPAVVAVVLGDGLARVFESLGAAAVVQGGQTMNPSTQDLLEAVEGLRAQEVILLPNNKNVILAAEQACALSEKAARVVPSRTIPQGVSALLALNLQAELDDNVAAMTAALAEVETGEITTATRSVRLNGVEVGSGQIIGLLNGELLVAGDAVDDVTHALLQRMHPEDCEIITLYYGGSVSADEADAFSQRVQADWPDQEVEVVAGGQEHYHYFVSVE
jgi:DAK2 domain fusion protein YloV